jgi:hypothetical protein
VLGSNWADQFLEKLTFRPERVFNFSYVGRDLQKFLDDVAATKTRGKIGVMRKPAMDGMILFIEFDEDAVLIKMFFA